MFNNIDWHALLQQFLYDPKNPLLFNNGFFVYLFFVFMMVYYLLRNNFEARTNFFCFVSLYFFYKASGFFVVFVIISAIVGFLLSDKIYKQAKHKNKTALLVISLIINLGLLAYFKYTNFFIELINSFFKTNFNALNILLPVGISFYTFENISYTVDVYRGEFIPVKKFNQYLLFLSFFPKLVMGPIVRAKDFIPQISKPFSISKEDFAEGFYLIVSGLFKKLIISDYITLNLVNYVFDAPERYTGLECLFGLYGYAMVIYCDFSGYSSIAIGIARWLGFKIPPNFLTPYQSLDITEFWRRWHISLSSWLRDYLYIPLGGNRKGKIRTYINLFITMLLGGLWHGASLNFVFWGGLHGIALAIHKIWTKITKGKFYFLRNSSFYKLLSIIITFHFVCFCWIFFKAKNFIIAQSFIHQILHNLDFSIWINFWQHYQSVILMIFLAVFLHFIPNTFNNKIPLRLSKLGLVHYTIIFILFLIVYAFYKSSQPVMPIYLQF